MLMLLMLLWPTKTTRYLDASCSGCRVPRGRLAVIGTSLFPLCPWACFPLTNARSCRVSGILSLFSGMSPDCNTCLITQFVPQQHPPPNPVLPPPRPSLFFFHQVTESETDDRWSVVSYSTNNIRDLDDEI